LSILDLAHLEQWTDLNNKINIIVMF